MIKRILPFLLYFLFASPLISQPMSLEEAEQCVENATTRYALNGNARLDSAQMQCLEEAIDLFIERAPENFTQAGMAFFLLANQSFLREQPAQTDSLLRAGIDLAKKDPSPSADSLLAVFYNYANILYSEYYYDFERAMSANQLSIEYHQRIDEKRGLVAAYLNGASAYARFGYCDQAAGYLEKARALLPEVLPFYQLPLHTFSRYVNGIIAFYRASEEVREGNFEAATPHLESSRTIFWNLVPFLRFSGQQDKLQRVYFALAGGYLLSFPPDKVALDSAAFYLDAAYEVGLEAAGESHPTLQFLKEAGIAYRMAPDSALQFLNGLSDSLGLYREGRNTKLERHPGSFPSKYRALEMAALKAAMLFVLYEKENYLPFLDRGLSDLELLAKLLNRLRYQYGTGKSQQIAGEWFPYFFALGSNMAERLYGRTGDEKYLERGLALSELTKSYVLRQSVYQKLSQHTFEGVEKTINDQIVRLQQAVGQRTVEYRQAPLRKREEAGHALLETKIRLWDYLDGLKNGTPEEQKVYRQRFDNRSPALEQIQNWLPENTAIIDYNTGIGQTTVYVLTKSGVRVDTLSSAREWQALVDEFAKGVKNDPMDFPETAHALYNQVGRKIIEKLPGRIQRLIIIPEHQLWRVSFGALVTSAEEERYLIQDYDIDYSFSISMLLYGKENDSTGNGEDIGFYLAPGASVAANTPEVYCSGQFPSLNTLSATARQIAREQPEAVLIDEATKQQFLDQAGQYGALAMVLHGCADSLIRNPLDYSLVFEKETGDTDQLLTGWELYNMDLTGTRWAFLGVCNIAWGRLQLGEGLASLANALAAAGCPNLIVSRYPAVDEPTAMLMDLYFEELSSGATVSAALSEAQRRMISEGFLPSEWANMMLIGRGN